MAATTNDAPANDAAPPPTAGAPHVPPADWRWDHNASHRSVALMPIYAATRLLPRAVAQGIAWVIGTLVAHGFRRTRRVIAGNVRRLGGGAYSEWQVQRLVTATIRNWGRCVVDAMYLAQATPARIQKLVGSLQGGELLDAALAGGRGAVLITPHLGHWELGGAVLATAGYPLNVVSVIVPDAAVRHIKHGFRERLGIKQVYVQQGESSPVAMLGILDALRGNEIVAMLPDRESAAEHVRVRFCGDHARFPTGPAWLAVRTGATLLPAFVVRDPDGRYSASIEEPIPTPAADPHERRQVVADVTQAIATRFEAIIRRYPEQWYNFFPSWEAPDPPPEAPA